MCLIETGVAAVRHRTYTFSSLPPSPPYPLFLSLSHTHTPSNLLDLNVILVSNKKPQTNKTKNKTKQKTTKNTHPPKKQKQPQSSGGKLPNYSGLPSSHQPENFTRPSHRMQKKVIGPPGPPKDMDKQNKATKR